VGETKNIMRRIRRTEPTPNVNFQGPVSNLIQQEHHLQNALNTQVLQDISIDEAIITNTMTFANDATIQFSPDYTGMGIVMSDQRIGTAVATNARSSFDAGSKYMNSDESYSFVKQQWAIDPKELIGFVELRRLDAAQTEYVVQEVRGEWGKGAEVLIGRMGDPDSSYWVAAGLSSAVELRYAVPFVKPTSEERRARTLASVTESMQKIANGQRLGYENQLSRRLRDVESYTETLKKLKVDIAIYRKRLKDMPVVEINLADVESSMQEVLKHKKIQDVYITKIGSIAIVTKMLYKLDPKTQKEDESVEIGRFVIDLMPSDDAWYISAWNLDYVDECGYSHPNINSFSVCLGEHENEIRKSTDLYMIADFFVVFLSQFPHDSGMPFTDPFEWLDTKHKREDAVILKERL
jgi:hypothetical protein